MQNIFTKSSEYGSANKEDTIESIRNQIQTQIFKNDIQPFDTVLIIDGNLPIILSLKDYLKKIGLQNIYSVRRGTDAIQVFRDLEKVGINPIIILDDLLQDVSSKDIIKKIFDANPDTKIILETVPYIENKKDIELINLGIYDVIEKPIRYDNVQRIITQLRKEKNLSKDNEEMTINEEENIKGKILSYFEISGSLSKNQLYELINKEQTMIDNVLERLVLEGKIVFLKTINEILCPDCGSLRIKELFQCPSCKNTDFKHTNLIEHHKCGNVSSIDTYIDNSCPKCRDKIKILGVDYTKLSNYYSCMECKDIFPELMENFKCMKCTNAFNIHDAMWNKSDLYRIKAGL